MLLTPALLTCREAFMKNPIPATCRLQEYIFFPFCFSFFHSYFLSLFFALLV